MHPYWKGIRGQKWVDTFALYFNRVVYALRSRMGNSSPPHWLISPFDLRSRVYRIPHMKGAWVDGAALLWGLLDAETPDFPQEWLGRLQTGLYGIDIGAHKGYWLILHRELLNSEARILAFEPFPLNIPSLIHNLFRNNLQQVSLLQIALGEKPGLLKIAPVDSGVLGAMGITHLTTSPFVASSYRVQVGRLDDIVPSFHWPRVDWIKLDIDGGEAEALHGAKTILKQYRPHLWIEIHHTFEKVYPILLECDYKLAAENWYFGYRKDLGRIWAVPVEEEVSASVPSSGN